jgi:hypothetical protein
MTDLIPTHKATNQMLVSGINVCLISQAAICSDQSKKEWATAAAEMCAELESRGVTIQKMESGPDQGLYRLK